MRNKSMNSVIMTLATGIVMLSGAFTATAAASSASSVPLMYGSLGGGSPAWSNGAIKPKAVYFGVGGDRNITDVQWSHWNARTASGQGELHQRICWGSCFKYRITTVGVALWRVGIHRGVRYFTRMTLWQSRPIYKVVYSYSTYGSGTVPFWH